MAIKRLPQTRDCLLRCRIQGAHTSRCSGTWTNGRGEQVDCRGCVVREAAEGNVFCGGCLDEVDDALATLYDIHTALADTRRGADDAPKVSGSKPRTTPLAFGDGRAAGDMREEIRVFADRWTLVICDAREVVSPRVALVQQQSLAHQETAHWMLQALDRSAEGMHQAHTQDALRAMLRADFEAKTASQHLANWDALREHLAFLASNLDWLLESKAGKSFVREIKSLYRRTSRRVEPKQEDGTPRAAIRSVPLADAHTLSRYIKIEFGREISPSTIRQWNARGYIARKDSGQKGVKAVYSVAEVFKFCSQRFGVAA